MTRREISAVADRVARAMSNVDFAEVDQVFAAHLGVRTLEEALLAELGPVWNAAAVGNVAGRPVDDPS